MPGIEELPLTNPRAAQPGWAYVADSSSSLLPSQSLAAGGQAAKRKRGAAIAATATSASAISSKQQKAIDQRLKDLDRENYKDGVVVAVPKAESSDAKGGFAAAAAKKQTSNVRRILGYNRNFGHFLADEEAAIAAGGGGFQGTWGSGVSTGAQGLQQGQSATAAKSDRRRSGAVARGAAAVTPAKGKEKAETPVKTEQKDGDVNMTGTDQPPATPQAQQVPSSPSTNRPVPRYDIALDSDPLLKTLHPLRNPADRVIAALLAEPPLSWSAARAEPPPAEKQTPRRWFCAMCGYWGKVKCSRCGERCCGLLECWRGHEAGGCVPY